LVNISMKKILLSPWTAVLTLFLVSLIKFYNPTFVESVKLRYFDTLITNKTPTENPIYTVNIDEAALDKYGQWPFARTIYADMIKDIYARGASLVVWTVLMPEADRQGGDGVLADTLKQYPVILSNIPSSVNKNTPRLNGAAIVNSNFIDRIYNYPGIIANIPELENTAIGVGTTNVYPEIDGVNRRIPLLVGSGGKLYPTIGIETLRVLTNEKNFKVKLNEIGIDKMGLGKSIFTTDQLGRIWIDLSQQHKQVSVTNMPEKFDGAVVIVGTSAAGIANPVPTAVGAVYPQDIQAKIIATLANKVNIERPSYAEGAELIALVLGGLLLLFLTRWVYVGLGSVIILVGGSVACSFYMFNYALQLWDATAIVGGLVLVALHAYGVKFVSEFLQKQQIKKQFGTYLSPAMVEKLQKNPELLQLGGDSRELSIMFTDVRGFTSISEHYGADVQGLTKIMNRYMTAMTSKILENEGTLDKYIGDAQMAFWNAPLDNPDHAKHAVKTALEMLGSLDAFNREVAAEGVPPFGMGLGINTATVVVGNMGSSQRFDYTCLGDGVNLASRLEGQSKPYHVAMVIGPKTNEYVKDDYFTLELDCIAVKGKKEGVNIFTVLEQRGDRIDYLAKRVKHQEMMQHYRNQQFIFAIDKCKELIGSFNGQMDGYYEMWLERCTEMYKNPPGLNWDGVYRTNTK
jgi:adenylate cyclase